MTRHLTLGAMLALLLSSGCAMQGVGIGETVPGGLTARFAWHATAATEGTIEAMLSDGRVYRGVFFQITSETRVDRLGPLWDGWHRPGVRPGWDYWGPYPEIITHYSGRVLANMDGPEGHMRCRFVLRRPSSGMIGGGQGRCQLPDKTEIEAQFTAQ